MIGTTYQTIKGGTLTVVGVEGQTCYLECSICSLDKELFKDPFKVNRYSLVSCGARPCICSLKGGFSWSKEQQALRCKRVCESNGEEFLGFNDETFKGSSKIKVKCVKGHITNTRTIFNLLSGTYGCSECRGDKISKSSTHMWVGKKRFVGDITHTVKEFTPDKYLLYECSSCSLDKELFPDLFRISRSDWKKRYTCGCVGQTRWTKEQFKVLCARAVEDKEGITFIDLVGDYKGCYTNILQNCEIHGEWDTSTIDKLIYSSRGCPTCASTNHPAGLYTKRLEDLDVLYLLRFTNSSGEVFIKVGRTFYLKERITEFMKFYDIEVLSVHTDSHKIIRPLEKELHNKLYSKHYTPNIPFGGSVQECFTEEALLNEDIIKVFHLKG